MTNSFKRITYPDGQIGAEYIGGEQQAVFGTEARIGTFTISERINSYTDLFYIRAIADILNNKGVGCKHYKLFIPCMFGQRSDRRFSEFQSFDLKLITDIINECGFGRIEILDPHSDVTLALIENSEKISSFEYVEKAIKHYHDWNAAHHNGSVDPILVSPDAGAFKKVFEYGEKLGLEVVGANKFRDKEGKVTLKFIGDVKDKVCFIVDDLCDGGYTFITLAKALKEQGAREVYLYVTHGIFSKGFTELTENIRHIYTTNSVKDLDLENRGTFGGSKLSEYLTQFKVI